MSGSPTTRSASQLTCRPPNVAHIIQSKPHVPQSRPHPRQSRPCIRQARPQVRQSRPHIRQSSPYIRKSRPHIDSQVPSQTESRKVLGRVVRRPRATRRGSPCNQTGYRPGAELRANLGSFFRKCYMKCTPSNAGGILRGVVMCLNFVSRVVYLYRYVSRGGCTIYLCPEVGT